MATTTAPHVIIIGSGITGLLIAQGLKKVICDFMLSYLQSESHD